MVKNNTWIIIVLKTLLQDFFPLQQKTEINRSKNRKGFPVIRLGVLLVILFLTHGFFTGYPNPAIGEENIRKAILAGTWYPKDKNALEKSIQGYLSGATVEAPKGRIRAIIVPHAGHRYSGQVAAYAYSRLQGMVVKRVVMIGPCHRFGFKGASVNLQKGYQTPLGIVPVDQACAKELIDAGHHINWIPQAHAREHSLEIQLPFLQIALGEFQIVPILMGAQDLKTCTDLAQVLVQTIKNRDHTLILASTDLSHFHTYDQAKALDERFIKYVLDFDPEGLAHALSDGVVEACGGGPVITTLLSGKALGANRAVGLRYANSGDVTGDHKRVVGYFSAILLEKQ